MQREKDYLKKKIDKAVKALAELLLRINQADYLFEEEEFQQELNSALSDCQNLDLATLKKLPLDSFIKELREKHDISGERIMPLADLLHYYSSQTDEEKLDWNQKIVLLYEYAIAEQIPLSLDRYTILDELKRPSNT